MRKLLISIFVLLAAGEVWAQPIGARVYRNSSGVIVVRADNGDWLTASGSGAPTFTSFLNENVPNGATYINTATASSYYFNSGSWTAETAGSGSAITAGTTAITGGTDCFGYADASSIFQCDNTLAKLDNSGAGNGVLQVRKTASGVTTATSGMSYALTLPSAASTGAFISITGAGATGAQTGLDARINAGYTGSGLSAAVAAYSLGNSTGTSFTTSSNVGLSGYAASTATGNTYIGVVGNADGRTNDATSTSRGVIGVATGTKASNVGGTFIAGNAATAFIGVLGYTSTPPTLLSAVALFHNAGDAVPIIVAKDNDAALPTTGATATWQIADGAWPQAGNAVLTSATMTAEVQGRQSGAVHSYTWTNAQVAALGASLEGDITVATLPAKTQVKNAYVVITGQGAGTTTLTVSCGDANDGTPFDNFIVPSDAKAAANTVYGDAVGERGASLDVEFYYLPSYTATTLVTCHFISTVENLSAVTGSTGRVILETVTLP